MTLDCALLGAVRLAVDKMDSHDLMSGHQVYAVPPPPDQEAGPSPVQVHDLEVSGVRLAVKSLANNTLGYGTPQQDSLQKETSLHAIIQCPHVPALIATVKRSEFTHMVFVHGGAPLNSFLTPGDVERNRGISRAVLRALITVLGLTEAEELVYYDMKVEQLLLQRRGDTFQANVVDLASIGNEDHVHNWSLHTIPPEAAKDTLMAGGMFERATMSDHAGKPFGRWAAALTVLEALFGVNPFWPTGKQVAAAERRIEEEEDELREEGEWPPCGYDVMDLGPWVYALLLNVAKGLSYLRAHPLWALLTADERDLFEAALHADPALRASPAQLRATAVGAAVFEGGCGVGQWEGWESRDEAELRKEGEEGWWVKKQEAAGGDEEGARASKSRGAASGRGMPGRAWRSCVGCMPGRAAHKGALVRAASAPPSFAAAASSCCALGLSSAPSAPAASESEDERECMDAVGRATSGSCEGPSASSCGSLDAHVCVLPLSASCGSSSSAISSTLNGGTSPGFDADAEATCVIRAASPLECGGFAAHAKMAACVKGTAGFEAPRTDASCACLPEGHDDAGRDEPLPLCPSSPRSISRDLHPPTPVPALAPLPSVGTCCASPSSPSGPRSGGGSCGDGASQAPAVAHVLPHGKKRRSKGERDTRTFAQRVRGAAHKADKEVSKAAVAVAKSADDAVSRLTAAASRAKAALKGMFKRVPKC